MQCTANPPTKEELEAKIQDAEEEIDSFKLRINELLDNGAKAIFDQIHEISLELNRQGRPGSLEAKELLKKQEILAENLLYVEVLACMRQSTASKVRLDSYQLALKHLNLTEAPPIALVPEISLPKARATLSAGSNVGKSESPISSDSEPTLLLPTQEELETKIQEAKEEIDSFTLRINELLKNEAKPIFDHLHEISLEINRLGPHHYEAKELYKKEKKLTENPLFVEVMNCMRQRRTIQSRCDEYMRDLSNLKAKEAPRIAPLTEFSLSETSSQHSLLPPYTAKSDSPSSSVSDHDSPSFWGRLAELVGLVDKKKEKNM